MKFTCFPKSSENEKAEKERTQSAERIQSLHTRLHQEAEKIRKWKTSTEMEMKEKVIGDFLKYDLYRAYENKVGLIIIKNSVRKINIYYVCFCVLIIEKCKQMIAVLLAIFQRRNLVCTIVTNILS